MKPGTVINKRESSYLEILQKTQGAWRKEDWSALRRKRRKIELTASKKRKQAKDFHGIKELELV